MKAIEEKGIPPQKATTMNTNKIKTALTLGFLNSSNQSIPKVQGFMQQFKPDIGNFLGSKVVEESKLNTYNSRKLVTMAYERMTLDIHVVANLQTNTQVIQGFSLR